MTSRVREFRRKYTHLKADKKLIAKSDNSFFKKCYRALKNVQYKKFTIFYNFYSIYVDF